MNRSLKWSLFAAFVFSFGFDRLSKACVDQITQWPALGPLFFQAHSNPGFILQSMSDTSSLARVVFVSSLYGFLFFGFFLLHAILPAALPKLRVGITLFFSAITGNCYDRAFNGAVSDFICFRFSERVVYFNLADVVMWVGLGLILTSLYQSDRVIWHPNSKRKKYLVDQVFQYKWAVQTSLIALSSTLILILFSYSYLMHGPMAGQSGNGMVYLLSAGSLGVLFSAVIFYAGVLFSHRSAGPLYAFERYVEGLLNGESQEFTLRKTDDHQNLILVAEKLKNNLIKNGEIKNEKN